MFFFNKYNVILFSCLFGLISPLTTFAKRGLCSNGTETAITYIFTSI